MYLLPKEKVTHISHSTVQWLVFLNLKKKKKKLKVENRYSSASSSKFSSFLLFPLSNKYEAIKDQRSFSKTDTIYLVPVFWKSKNQKETSTGCGRDVT